MYNINNQIKKKQIIHPPRKRINRTKTIIRTHCNPPPQPPPKLLTLRISHHPVTLIIDNIYQQNLSLLTYIIILLIVYSFRPLFLCLFLLSILLFSIVCDNA